MQLNKCTIVIIALILFSSCESKRGITEQNLLGMWKEIVPNLADTNESKGILISEIESGLYQEEIVILKNTGKSNYSIFSNGCFIKLKLNEEKEQSLSYLCLASEFEHKIYLTNRKLIIGSRKFVKYGQ